MSLASLSPASLGETSLLDAIRFALLELETAGTVDEVFHQIAEAATFLGLDHLQVSRFDGGRWRTVGHRGYADPRWHSELQALATGAEHTPPGHHLSAPIVVDGVLAGLIQARRHPGRRPADAADAASLLLLAHGIGRVIQQLTLAACLEVIRETLAYRPARPTAVAMGPTRLPAPADRSVAGANDEPAAERAEAWDCPLTERERDIMERVARGDTNAQVARQLYLSEGTVKWHVKNILRKLEAPNRAAAVSSWLRG